MPDDSPRLEQFHAPPSLLWLCPDCGEVGTDDKKCLSCAHSLGLMNLGVLLNRTVEADEKTVDPAPNMLAPMVQSCCTT